MIQTMPWLAHHIDRNGLIDISRTPTIPLRRKLGAVATVLVTAAASFLQWDVQQSETNTPDIPPKVMMADGSIPCKGARAILGVVAGYGIQNNYVTAANIATIANEELICTVWVDNGNNINVPAVGEALVDMAEKNDVEEFIGWGESVGGDEVALVENYIVGKYGTKFKFPAAALDASPGNKRTLKWVDRGAAEKVAEYCQYLKLGDITMTAISLWTDQNAKRRSEWLEYWGPVYEATRSASMRLRTAQSCMAGVGFQPVDKQADTHIFYLRAADGNKDPIVDVELSEQDIKSKTDADLFHTVLMDADGITHASAWDNWYAYEKYYREVIKRISSIMELRQTSTWYKRALPR